MPHKTRRPLRRRTGLESRAQMNANTPNLTGASSAATLTELLEANRGAPRSIIYLEGERETRSVPYGELHQRALAILHRLQRLGARPGDKLILFLSGN